MPARLADHQPERNVPDPVRRLPRRLSSKNVARTHNGQQTDPPPKERRSIGFGSHRRLASNASDSKQPSQPPTAPSKPSHRQPLFRAPSFVARKNSSHANNSATTPEQDTNKNSVLLKFSGRFFGAPVAFTSPEKENAEQQANNTNAPATAGRRFRHKRMSLSKEGDCPRRKRSLDSVSKPENDMAPRVSLDRGASIRRSSKLLGLLGARVKLADMYSVDDEAELLGQGTFAEVRGGHERTNMLPVAIKTIDVVMGDREVKKAIECEKKIARLGLRHLHIVRVHDIFTTMRNTHLVMELMTGSLEEILRNNQRLKEHQARLVMHHLMQAMAYLREKNIVHRDIKPDNLLFTANSRGDLCFKLSDFGLAEALTMRKSGRLAASGTYGTPFFASPEVINNEEYDCSADMWSAGVMLYVLLSGVQPFDGPNPREVMRRARTGRLDFPRDLWDDRKISSNAVKLIRSMVRLGPQRRPTPMEVLNHSWFAALPREQYAFSQ